MKKGYEFSKKATRYHDIENYVEGIVDALENWSYSTGLSQKENEEFLKAAQSLKIDIIEFERLLSKEAEFSKILPYHMHNKSANNIVSNSLEEIREQQKVLQQKIKSNIAKVWIAPSTLGIKEDKKMGTIETKTKQQLWSDEKGKDYGFDKYTYEGNFAQANRELLDDMFDICEERSKGDVQKAYSESSDYVEEQEDKQVVTAINGNEYFFGRSFDTKGTVRDNPATIYVLRELSEINEEKFCLLLEIPDEVYKRATPEELKMIEKYKKAINKKKEALAKIEKQTMELVGPRRNKADIKMAIKHLSGDSKIPEETKQKLLKTLNAQLREEEKKEAKIQKKLEAKRKRSKIGKYDKNKYEVYSDMAKMQEDYELSSVETSNEKTFIQEDIARLTRALQNDSLSNERNAQLQEELEQKKIKLSNLGNNSLDASERHDYKKKIISFWKYTIAKEVSPKKQEPLLLTEGVQKETVSARDKFVAELNFTPEETITTPTIEKDTIVQQNDSKDGIEPGDK